MAGREEGRRAESARLRRTDEVDVGSWFWRSEDCRNRDAKQGGCNCPAQDGISAHDVSPAGEFFFVAVPPLVDFFLGAAVRLWSTRTLHLASSDQAVRNFRSEAFAAPCQT